MLMIVCAFAGSGTPEPGGASSEKPDQVEAVLRHEVAVGIEPEVASALVSQ